MTTEEQVDSLALHVGPADGPSNLLGDPEHLTATGRVEVVQSDCVSSCDDQLVPRGDRVAVGEDNDGSPDGEAALQEIFHIHLHVLPRYGGDAFRLDSGQSTVATARDELDEIAAKIRLRLATT